MPSTERIVEHVNIADNTRENRSVATSCVWVRALGRHASDRRSTLHRYSVFMTFLLALILLTSGDDGGTSAARSTPGGDLETLIAPPAGGCSETAPGGVGPGPVILSATETAGPNDLIGLQGSSFGSSPEVWMAHVDGSESSLSPQRSLDIVSASTVFVAARIPGGRPLGLYAVWVKDGPKLSNPVWINQARATGFDTPEVAGLGTFRVWGRNLVLPGQESRMRFIHASEGTSLAATVTGGDAYGLQVAAPAGMQAGVRYKLALSNGHGGCWGEVLAPETLLARMPGQDPWQLAVPWAADFEFHRHVFNVRDDTRLVRHARGDGSADDRPAIQAAIDAAHTAGGGVVYLPAGTYQLRSNDPLLLGSRVVLQGDGIDRTRIEYGIARPYTSAAIIWEEGATTSGLVDLTLRRVQTSGKAEENVKNQGNNSQLFIHRVKFTLTTSDVALEWRRGEKLLLSSSIFHVSPEAAGPLNFRDLSYFIVRGNELRYLRFRLVAEYSRHGLFEGNRVIRDGTMRRVGPDDAGMINYDFVRNMTNN